MEFLLANYKLILGIIIVIGLIIYSGFKFLSQPTSKQKERIRTILLNLVIMAEKEFGSKSGKLKFSVVYSELISKLSYLKYVPLSVVESLIEESLTEMRHLLETNPKVAEIVNKDVEKWFIK